jgi:antitoxin ChpS
MIMPYAARLRRVGGSVMLAIPKPMLDALELGPDASVGLSIKHGRLVLDPKKRPRYSLDELLAQSKRSARRSRDERAWLDGPAIGRELI